MVEVAASLQPIPNESTEDRSLVSLMDVADEMARVVLQVRGGHYRRALGIHRRLDWPLSVSSHTTGERGTTSVGVVVGPGAAPVKQAKSANAAFPNPQFGVRALRSKRQRADPARILQSALDDWLSRSGYWAYEDLLADVIDQALQRARIRA